MKYTPSQVETLFKKVIAEVEKGKALNHLLGTSGFPSRRKFYDWVRENEDMRERYARACEIRADAIFDEIIQIADDSTNDSLYTDKGEVQNTEWVNRSRIKIDARKWVLSKMQPKKYGDKLDVTSDNKAIALPPIIGMVIKNETTEQQDEPQQLNGDYDQDPLF